MPRWRVTEDKAVIEIKLFEKDGKWAIQLTDDLIISGFPDEGIAGIWLLEHIQRMATVNKMDETRRMMAGAILLKDDKKKSS